jgi:hypothetical protein
VNKKKLAEKNRINNLVPGTSSIQHMASTMGSANSYNNDLLVGTSVFYDASGTVLKQFKMGCITECTVVW